MFSVKKSHKVESYNRLLCFQAKNLTKFESCDCLFLCADTAFGEVVMWWLVVHVHVPQ